MQVKQQARKRVIAEAEEAEPELLPEIKPADVEKAEEGGSIKVHVELPHGEIVSFRVKKRRLGDTFEELCAVLVRGVPNSALSAAQLASMEMQYEDKDGDMLLLTSNSDVAELVHDAQAIFISKRTKKAGTRISSAPRQLTAAPGAHEDAAAPAGGDGGSCCALSLPASPPMLEDRLTQLPL